MRCPHGVLFVAAGALLASWVFVRAETDEKGFVRIRPEQLEWKAPFPGATPLALLEGDPSKPGIYVLRVQFPPKVFSRPHKHREDRLPSVMSDLVRRGVAVIATPGSNPASLAAKAATAAIPIVFGVGDDPVKLGLVASLARPGGNATGINFLAQEITTKQLGLLRELMPKAERIAVLVNPLNASVAKGTLIGITEAAPAFGLQIEVLKASTGREIEGAFADLTRQKANALFVASEAFLISRRVQIATLAARYVIATILGTRDFVDAGGLMSYGADFRETYRHIGDYTTHSQRS
jgi:ABC-type uncharacterized transport system substrate-binding protein